MIAAFPRVPPYCEKPDYAPICLPCLLLRVSNVEDVARAAYESALLILIPTYLGGLLVVWLYGKGPAVRHAWPLVLILGTILGVGQLLAAFISPELSTFLAAAVALLALYPLSRWKKYGEPIPIQEIPERPGMMETKVSEQKETAPVMGLSLSFLPYLVLTAVTLGVLDHSGQILTLAYGIAAVSPPLAYAGIASVIGALDAFMTSSSTASCVLFGAVQSSVAQPHGMSCPERPLSPRKRLAAPMATPSRRPTSC
jgi:L-lactate permease